MSKNIQNIYVISDLHFGHNKEFVWKDRGYDSVSDMNEQQIIKFNSVVGPDDEVYILGDVLMGDSKETIKHLKELNGVKYLIKGNHDTEFRIELYEEEKIFKEIYDAKAIKIGKYTYYMSHYPTLVTTGCGKFLGIHGHTHQKEEFLSDEHSMYSVCCDTNNGYPVSLAEIKEKVMDRNRQIKQGD